MSSKSSTSRQQKIAKRRLRRDLLELQREKLFSIAACPMDDNIFEWHANIKPNDGVYSGVYLHLILTFPASYPSKPPKVKIMTRISHPNVFSDWICLSMLREHTGTVPYEGWSGAYSVLSILMQLQSFLFADKIDQDGGYQVKARLSPSDVQYTLKICKTFHCKCGHSHHRPFPSVQLPPNQSLISVYATDPRQESNIEIKGSSCQTTRNKPVGVYGQYGCNYGTIMYEACVDWLPTDEWNSKQNPPYMRFGLGTDRADVCGRDTESFGYTAQGIFIYDNNNFLSKKEKKPHLPPFSTGDTITCAVDFDTKQVYFAKNGDIVERDDEAPIYIPQYLQEKQLLFPMLAMKEARASFNFGSPRKPCAWLMGNGFKTLEQIATEHGVIETRRKRGDTGNKNKKRVNWHSKFIIDELWVDIFEHLTMQNVFKMQFVCRKWSKLIHSYNIMERGEMYCYFTKLRLAHGYKQDKILGIGLSIKESEVGYRVELNSQMDILSLAAWKNGCRVGVWGESLTHFLPLPMNKAHADLAHDAMISAMKLISGEYRSIQTKSFHFAQRMENPNPLERRIARSECLQIVDTLVTMMNQIVAQFVTGNDETDPKSVSMVLCEKVVLGYCALHHLLLYLRSKNKKAITNLANKTIEEFITLRDGASKRRTRDLGKLLIYLMLCTKYEWADIAARFVEESFTRRIRWFVQHEEYKKYDTTKCVSGRIRASIASSKTGRRLVMFQAWFMSKNSEETLRGYHHRLGRPKHSVRNAIVAKTKQILSSNDYTDYFKELKVSLRNEAAMDQMLRFAVWNSYCCGYHWNKDVESSQLRNIYKPVNPPKMTVYGGKQEEEKKKKKMKPKKKANVVYSKQNVRVIKPNVKKPKPMRAPIPNAKKIVCHDPDDDDSKGNEKEMKLSKSQRRKQRRNKTKNGPSRPPLSMKTIVYSKPTRAPLSCNTFRQSNVVSNATNHATETKKLSKAQRRKLRRNKKKEVTEK